MTYLIGLFLLWVPNFYIIGKDFRLAQETLYQLFAILLFFVSLFTVKRTAKLTWVSLWLGIFGLWTLFLYTIAGMQIGYNFLFNIFACLLIYQIAVTHLKVENTRFLFNCILGVWFFNTVYTASQFWGYDICGFVNSGNPAILPEPCGLLALPAHYGIYTAVAMMVLASRYPVVASLLFGFIATTKSTGALAGAVVGYTFILWVRRGEVRVWIPFYWRKVWHKIYLPVVYFMTIFLLIGASLYVWKVDRPMGMMETRPKAWAIMINDAMKHPLWGWGLDSLRCGNHIYVKDTIHDNTLHAVRIDNRTFQVNENEIQKYELKPDAKFDVWDNAHNEYVSLLYHFSIVGVFIICMVLYSLWNRLKRVNITPELASIIGIMLVFLVSGQTQFPFEVARLGHLVPIILGLYMIHTSDF